MLYRKPKTGEVLRQMGVLGLGYDRPEDGSLIESTHVALHDTICMIKLSCADWQLVYL
jgi:hypothetical protein